MSPALHSLEETASTFSRTSRRLQRSFQNPEEVSYHKLVPEKMPPKEISLFPSADIASTPVTLRSERSNLPNIQDQGELSPYLGHTSGNSSRATVYALRGLHDAYPTLRTTESYNLLIGCAVRQGEYNDAGRLFQEMVEAGCIPNMHTWCLRVRLYMAEGCPELAYRCAINGIDPGRLREINKPGPVPFSLWVEMLKPAGRRRMIKPRLKESPPSLTRHQECKYVLSNERPFVPFELLFAREILPSLGPPGQMDYRAVADMVAYLRSQGRRDAALRMTLAWISSLPSNITAEDNMQAFHIIDRNFHNHCPNSSPRAQGHKFIVQAVWWQVDLILQLHGLHRQLRPPSFSIQRLLRILRLLRNPATEVAAVIAKLETVWRNVLDFQTRSVVLNTLLKDQAPYRLAAVAKRLIRAQDEELACKTTTLCSDPFYPILARPRGQDVSRYFALKAKAVRRGIARHPVGITSSQARRVSKSSDDSL